MKSRTRKKRKRYEIIYRQVVPTVRQSFMVIQLESQPSQGRSRAGRHPRGALAPGGAWLRTSRQGSKDARPWIWNDNLDEKKVNIAVLCQSVTKSSVSLCVCVCVCVSQTYRISDLSGINKVRYFCKECVTVLSFLHLSFIMTK